MKSGLVSIIIPTHNRGDLLSRAIKSIINQTYTNWEAIIVVDHCIDNTSIVLENYSNNSKFEIIELNENVGGAKARNIGIKKARGDFIAFIDDDDEWYPEKLSTQVNYINNNKNVSIVSCNFRKRTKNKAMVSNKSGKINIDKMFYRNELGSFSFCLIKKEYIKDCKISDDLNACQDWDLWIKIMIRSNLCGYVLSDILVKKDNSHDFNRLTTNYQSSNESHLLFINKTKHLMSKTQYHYRLAIYHSRLSKANLDFISYAKSLYYLFYAFHKTKLYDFLILYPYWLFGDDITRWLKKRYWATKLYSKST